MNADIFRKIQFGFTSAEAESADEPDLLLNGYVDLNESFQQAMTGSKFLFLGYKGSGKSAIGERLKLLAVDRHDLFVRKMDLEDFPFTPFAKMIRGPAEPEAKYPTAWSWIILIYLMRSLGQDAGLRHPDMPSFSASVSVFAEMGLSPDGKLGDLVKTASKTSFKLMVPQLAELNSGTREYRPASDIPNFVELLREMIKNCRSNSQHFLVIDGLDDILTKRQVQYESLGALVVEANRLNQMFRSSHVPAKIILVCRTDLFERMQGANKNKIRQDYAHELDWYHDTRNPDKSLLVKIANARASRSLRKETDIFTDFLNQRIDNHSLKTSLLDLTRHTPRDFLALLKSIQEFSGSNVIDRNSVLSGVRSYSIKYFLPEINDELSGYCNPEEFEEVVKLLGVMRKREFYFSDFVLLAESRKSMLDRARCAQIFGHLFSCSAIGNVVKKPSLNTLYSFNFRNRHAVFDDRERVLLHKGLWKALNLV